MSRVRVAVLCSGGGTNLQAILDCAAAGNIPAGEIALVVSDNASAYALERAKRANVATFIADRKTIPDRLARERAILGALKEHGIGLVVLAGFMTILSEAFTKAYEMRIINVHPSLIPSFCGKGYYGINVHRAAIEYRVKLSGLTVHFVDERYDNGAIILQRAVEVLPGDTPETLQGRILEQEHIALPLAVRWLTTGKIVKEGRKVSILP